MLDFSRKNAIYRAFDSIYCHFSTRINKKSTEICIFVVIYRIFNNQYIKNNKIPSGQKMSIIREYIQY